MLLENALPNDDALRAAITQAYRANEQQWVEQLIPQAELPLVLLQKIQQRARLLVEQVRQQRLSQGGIDAFFCEYDLSSTEGIALMCLAEALLRVPDSYTIDNLLRDKISGQNWRDHTGQSHSLFVNAATWGLVLTGKVLSTTTTSEETMRGSLSKLVERAGAPVIRQAAKRGMQVLGKQFVMGETINEALKRAKEGEKRGYMYSYDMLGEAARTRHDAERYFDSYREAIQAVGQASQGRGVIRGPGISVKLSALHPRYELAQRDRVLAELIPMLKILALQAKDFNIPMTIDPEEAERLDISLDIVESVFSDPALNGWEGFGIGVQAYQKRALPHLDWLITLARKHQRRFMVRLLKGAYWDSEIKLAQVKGLSGYPVYTRKLSTDVSYQACLKKILGASDAIYPMFATHNAYTLATVLELLGDKQEYEFQCLHGMGYTLYDQLVGSNKQALPCRVYAPIGGHEDLLAYLVRRLLENGANTSFVNQVIDPNTPISELISDPVSKLKKINPKPHPKIALPKDLYGSERKNSRGIDLTNKIELNQLDVEITKACEQSWQAYPLINGENVSTEEIKNVVNPANNYQQIGTVHKASIKEVEQSLQSAKKAFEKWSTTPVEQRAQILEKAGDLLEERLPQFMALAIREAGKTINDAVAEVREAVDFCRYYALQARKQFANPVILPGPTGESNELSLHGRGVIVCISPWNFPLAIFMGQVTAALAAGNTVIAKPAEQTPLIAYYAVRLLHEAGIPADALHFLPGRGSVVGAKLVSDERIAGVVFTGSTDTAQMINQSLANRKGPIVPFIAETGGQNAMIVDSSALPEQVVADAVLSAFGSAGQRCSALRVMFVQDEIAPKIITMLTGAMAELNVADPVFLSTDIGPVIDAGAKEELEKHIDKMKAEAKLLYQIPVSENTESGSYVAPTAFELNHLEQLTHEVFGPVLHVIRYSAKQLDQVIESINNTGYGLTLGIQSRIENTIEYIQQRVRVGNIYVNRSMTGAVVGVQPFGGEGLSGTGPKAGGPHYLLRLCTERCVCVNTTAAGGNASLMSLGNVD